MSSSDFLRIKIPRVSKSKQDEYGVWIKGGEEKIKKLKRRVRSFKKIIDGIFGERFGFETKGRRGLEEEGYFKIQFEDILKKPLGRASYHFHHIQSRVLEGVLESRDWAWIKKKFKLCGGKRISKRESVSSKETGYYYLKGEDLNEEGGIERNGISWISKETYEKLKGYRIKTGEFCISIVGSLGKSALVKTYELGLGEDRLILSENLIKLIPKERINGKFYDYFFKSDLFKLQIDREHTIKSIKKLGLDKWKEIKVPNISLESQEEIVFEIEEKWEEQKKLSKEIKRARQSIERLVNRVFCWEEEKRKKGEAKYGKRPIQTILF